MAQHGTVFFSLAARDAAVIYTANQIKHPLPEAHRRAITAHRGAQVASVPFLTAHTKTVSAAAFSFTHHCIGAIPLQYAPTDG
jgi:hypothetical protein